MVRVTLPFLTVFFLLPQTALATNGLDLIGFGAESSTMGGADTAVARDTTALNTNPAGLTQIAETALDVYGALAYGLEVRHQDGFGNDRHVSNRVVGVGGFGYARHLADSNLRAGIGFFGQGGAGNVFPNLATAFGTRDDLSVLFRIAKLTPGIAGAVNDRFSLGVSASMVYADIQEKFFPNTSFFNAPDPAHSFYGFELNDAHGVSFSPKLGAMYKLSELVTLGASYTARSTLPLKRGTLISDQSALGLGKVTYRDTRIEGFALPREIALGVALRPSPVWLWSIKLNWIDWSEALKTATLTATDPDNPAAAPTLAATSTLDWHDQLVLALGAAHRLDEKITLRFGYNYGRNPIPVERTNPFLNAITEHHLTFGVGRRLDAETEITTGIEYAHGGKVTYTNPELPFGQDAVEQNNHVAFHFMMSRRW
jgi:long-chain fatty acid transport protein